MRSSCEASERKRRSRSSLAWRSAKARSIWPSIAFSARPRRPTSVRGVAGATRRERSPAAIAPAVAPMRSSGRSPRRISSQASAASASSTPAITISSMLRRRVSVPLTSVSGTAMTVMPEPVSLCLAMARYSMPAGSEPTVKIRGCLGVEIGGFLGSAGRCSPFATNS